MNKTVENIVEIIRFIIGIAFIVAMIAFPIFAIKQCNKDYQNHRQSLPTYRVIYGNFSGSTITNFETYKVENNHYTFFDANGNIVGDTTITGNNKISITRNEK